MNLLKQDEKVGRFTSSLFLYICNTKAMTALVKYGNRCLH